MVNGCNTFSFQGNTTFKIKIMYKTSLLNPDGPVKETPKKDPGELTCCVNALSSAVFLMCENADKIEAKLNQILPSPEDGPIVMQHVYSQENPYEYQLSKFRNEVERIQNLNRQLLRILEHLDRIV